MKLSVLIPTYNYCCCQLLEALARQLAPGQEILVMDDGSSRQDLAQANESTCKEYGIRHIPLEANIGRAAIRNRLAREAQGEWLLFIDNDSLIEDAHFLDKYMAEMGEAVICGTLLNPAELPSPEQSLRYNYERHCAPHFTWQQRNQHPYAHFRTSHFMIRRTWMLENPLDERIKLYGYEDVLFGKRLQKAGIPIRHVDIDVRNGDLEDNPTFLRKTEEQLQTLYQFSEELSDSSTLLVKYLWLRRHHLLWIVTIIYKLTKGVIKKNLLGKHPSIPCYQFYKLGYYTSLVRDRAERP